MTGIVENRAGKFGKAAYFCAIGLLAGLTLAALIDSLFGCGWGLGWIVFFVGFIATAWGAVAYPMWCGCCGWDAKRH